MAELEFDEAAFFTAIAASGARALLIDAEDVRLLQALRQRLGR